MSLSNFKLLKRRQFFKGAAGVTGAIFAGGAGMPAKADFFSEVQHDDPNSILTAALIAEDLATTFYYNGLIGKVIQDPNLAGPGGTATSVTPAGDAGNVSYIQAALGQEISHANLLRSLLQIPEPSNDPVQTFYFPAGTFDTLSAFTGLLEALENAFIGAYLAAVRQFAYMAAQTRANQANYFNANNTHTFNADDLAYYAQVSASIMGVECEHRVLGRDLSNTNPPNNLYYEQNDGITNVYTGSTSAVVALTPFLTPSTGPAYSFATALASQATVSIPSTGGLPSF